MLYKYFINWYPVQTMKQNLPGGIRKKTCQHRDIWQCIPKTCNKLMWNVQSFYIINISYLSCGRNIWCDIHTYMIIHFFFSNSTCAVILHCDKQHSPAQRWCQVSLNAPHNLCIDAFSAKSPSSFGPYSTMKKWQFQLGINWVISLA